MKTKFDNQNRQYFENNLKPGYMFKMRDRLYLILRKDKRDGLTHFVVIGKTYKDLVFSYVYNTKNLFVYEYDIIVPNLKTIIPDSQKEKR